MTDESQPSPALPFGVVYHDDDALVVVMVEFESVQSILAAAQDYSNRWYREPNTLWLNKSGEDIVIAWLNVAQAFMRRPPCRRGDLLKMYGMDVVLESRNHARG